jgi:hypothetical protein
MNQLNAVSNIYGLHPSKDEMAIINKRVKKVEDDIMELLRSSFTPLLDQPRSVPSSASIDLYNQLVNKDF